MDRPVLVRNTRVGREITVDLSTALELVVKLSVGCATCGRRRAHVLLDGMTSFLCACPFLEIAHRVILVRSRADHRVLPIARPIGDALDTFTVLVLAAVHLHVRIRRRGTWHLFGDRRRGGVLRVAADEGVRPGFGVRVVWMLHCVAILALLDRTRWIQRD